MKIELELENETYAGEIEWDRDEDDSEFNITSIILFTDDGNVDVTELAAIPSCYESLSSQIYDELKEREAELQIEKGLEEINNRFRLAM